MVKNLLHIISTLWSKLTNSEQRNELLTKEVSSLNSELELLKSRIKVLEGQKNKNSRNSSKPPSTDRKRKKGKKVVKNSREKSNRPTGGQKGNKGSTLEQVSDPKYIELHKATFCECGTDVSQEPIVKIEKRQVFEMEQPEIAVTEYQVEVKICPICEKIVKGVFPQGVTAPVQYGPKVKGAILDLNIHHFLSYERINIFFKDWFGQTISGGLIYDSIKKAHKILQQDYRTNLVNALLRQKILHGDETGLYYEGKRYWLHVLSTSKLTLFHAHKTRGSEAIEEMGVLPLFKGRVIHDNYKSYGIYQDCKHGLCNAHHLRELLYFEEEEQALWAYHLGLFLRSVNSDIKQHKLLGHTELPAQDLIAYRQRYIQILQTGYEQLPSGPPRKSNKGRPPKHPQHNLLDRFTDKEEFILAFMYDFDVPFDNNQAERDLRMVKTKQKVSGCFRSELGAQSFASIRGYISTSRKNSIAVLEALTNLMRGVPDMPF